MRSIRRYCGTYRIGCNFGRNQYTNADQFFFIIQKNTMLRFFYDSLETVKKLKHPTKKDYINLTLAIFAAVIIGSLYFVWVDSIMSNLYKIFYSVMKS